MLKKCFVLVLSLVILGAGLTSCFKKDASATKGPEQQDTRSTEGESELQTIVAAADPWPPFVDPSDPNEGLAMVLLRAAFKTQGYKVEMVYVPWARAEEGVKEGVYDILPDTWMTEARKEYLAYSEPFLVNEIKFIKLKDDPFEFDGLESLTGKTVGTVRSYGYADSFLKATNFTREEGNNLLINVRKLLGNRIDLTLEDAIVARVRISQEDPDILTQIAFTQKSLSRNPLYITSGLKNPRHTEIITAFNRGLAEIKTNGTFKEICLKYGINPDEL